MAHCHCAVMYQGRAASMTVNEEPNGEQPMSLESHLVELQRKHGDLQREIDDAMTHPSVDPLEIARLKRRKLAIKDEMEKLRVEQTRH